MITRNSAISRNLVFYTTYALMAIGLGVSALTSYWLLEHQLFALKLLARPWSFNLILFGQLALVISMPYVAQRVSALAGYGFYFLFCAMQGISLTPIFLLFTSASLLQTFLSTAMLFCCAALYGITTQRNLSRFGDYLMIGLLGLICTSFINYWFASESVEFFTSIIGVIIFTGLIAYDNQKLHRLSDQMAHEGYAHASIIIACTLNLYLDFINLFMFMLRFMGTRKRN